jgi:hypothetical protein
MRDIKSYERPMRRHGVRGTLTDRLDVTVHDLNEDRPRPILGGRTAREAYQQDQADLPSREAFIQEVDRREEERRTAARSRREVAAARRRAVEQALLRYGLMRECSHMSHDFEATVRTDQLGAANQYSIDLRRMSCRTSYSYGYPSTCAIHSNGRERIALTSSELRVLFNRLYHCAIQHGDTLPIYFFYACSVFIGHGEVYNKPTIIHSVLQEHAQRQGHI